MAVPTIVDINPNTNSPISDNSILQFSVIDTDNNLVRVAINAIFSNGDQEVIFDGSNFSARYIVNSTKTTITNGFRFRILRAGYWPDNPIIRVLAIDASINIIEQDLRWLSLLVDKPLNDFYQNQVRARSTSSSGSSDVVLQEVKKGLITPFTRDGKGDFANASGTRFIGANIRQILGTICSSGSSYGELEWMPEFGSLLDRLRHQPADLGTLELARLRVVDALGLFEPRVQILKSKCMYERNSEGQYAIKIFIVYNVLNAKNGSAIATNVPGSFP